MRGITYTCTFLVLYASCTNVTNECTTEKCYKRGKKAQCELRRQWICGYIDCWSKTHSLENIFSSPVATSTSCEPLFSQKGCQSTCKMCIHVTSQNVKSHTKPYANTRGKPESRMYEKNKRLLICEYKMYHIHQN